MGFVSVTTAARSFCRSDQLQHVRNVGGNELEVKSCWATRVLLKRLLVVGLVVGLVVAVVVVVLSFDRVDLAVLL